MARAWSDETSKDAGTISIEDAQDVAFTGVRRRYRTAVPFETVLARLHSEVGDAPVRINDVTTPSDDWTRFEEEMRKLVGPSDFMLFETMDHGAWVAKKGMHVRLLRFVIGNPIIAITLLDKDLAAGLFVPVELLLIGNLSGAGCDLVYVVPSTLIVVDENSALRAAAQTLDAKLDALAMKVTLA